MAQFAVIIINPKDLSAPPGHFVTVGPKLYSTLEEALEEAEFIKDLGEIVEVKDLRGRTIAGYLYGREVPANVVKETALRRTSLRVASPDLHLRPFDIHKTERLRRVDPLHRN